MSSKDLFVSAAVKFLSCQKKSLSVSSSLDLAAQVSAVDLSIKAALLYDTNGASAVQLQHYLGALQVAGLVSPSLLTLDVCGHVLIVNPVTVISNLEELLRSGGVAVIDVCHSLEKPAVVNLLREELRVMIEDFLVCLRKGPEMGEPLVIGENCSEWNLCTLFGFLLGYPVTYWFDQNQSSENCLAMTPLSVTRVTVSMSPGRPCCLYSFSVPTVLHRETATIVEQWSLRLRERFRCQNVFMDLSFHQAEVTLPSVCL